MSSLGVIMRYQLATKVLVLLLLSGSTFGQLQITKLLGKLKFEHLGTYDNCAFSPEFILDMSHGDSISIIESDTASVHAFCTCWYDLEYVFENPPPGDYTIHVFRQYTVPYYGDSLHYHGNIDVTISSDYSSTGRSRYQSACYYASTANLHYPLALGNEWHYASYWTPDTYEYGVQHKIHRITSDTLMSTGQRYWRTEVNNLMNANDHHVFYQRFDEATSIVFLYQPGICDGDEVEMFDLNYSGMGPYRWSGCADLVTRSNTYYDMDGPDSYLEMVMQGLYSDTKEFRDSIGLTFSRTSEIESYTRILKGWVINGVIGGQLLTSTQEDYRPIHNMLLDAFPNPFNPSTTISYDLPEYSHVNLTIYEVTGRAIVTLQDMERPAGQNEVQWDGLDQFGGLFSTGVYFARLQTEEFVNTVKMVLLK